MSVLPLIIRREYMARIRNKSFLIMTFLSPLIMVGMVMLISYLTQLNRDSKRVIALVDETGLFTADFKNSENITYLNLTSQGLNFVRSLAEEEKYYGVLHIPSDLSKLKDNVKLYGKETPNFELVIDIERKINKTLTNENLKNKGVDLDVLESSKIAVNLGIENYSGETSSKMSSWVKIAFGGAAGYLLMMFIIIYGNMVMRSVIEEKTNRIIEVIISSVKPFQLMMGKILGTTLAGITQFGIWVILVAVLFIVTQLVLGIDTQSANVVMDPEVQAIINDSDMLTEIITEILALPILQLVFGFFIYFIGGYFLYSSIYAAIGAAVDSETDTQQFMLPIIMPLMLAIYVGFFGVIDNPHGTVATIFSIVPLTSPIVMLMRIPFGVPGWQIALSMALLIASFMFTVWIGSKIYRVGILMYGKKPTYKELFKWLRY